MYLRRRGDVVYNLCGSSEAPDRVLSVLAFGSENVRKNRHRAKRCVFRPVG